MKTHIPLAFHVLSLVLVGNFLFGCFVTYAPDVGAGELQNIFLGRAIWSLIPAAILQIVAFVMMNRRLRSCKLRREGHSSDGIEA